MMGDLDIDIEELECRLYSQVYHSSVEDYENQNTISNVLQRSNTLRNQNRRYFCTQTRTKQEDSNDLTYISLNSNSQHLSTRSNLHAEFFKDDTNNVNIIPSIGNSSMPPPMDHMVDPYNNILPLPKIPQQIISNSEYEHEEMNTNLAKYLERQARRQLRKQKWIERNKQKRKNKKMLIKELKTADFENINENNDFKPHYLNENNILYIDDDIVVISDTDSEDDSCIVVPQKRELVILSDESDNEERKKENSLIKTEISTSTEENGVSVVTKQNDKLANNVSETKDYVLEDDDILIIDDIPIDVEVIDVDCDSKSVTNVDDNKVSSEKSLETTSTNSFIKKPSSMTHRAIVGKERNDLLRTPDSTSTSNDFLDNTIDLQQKKFNFALHGSDFDNTEVFIKPKSNMDIYETESSCSASDHGTPVKSNMFHEVEFDTPQKDFFNEDDLAAFGQYITPNRDNSIEKPSCSNEFEQVLTRASIMPVRNINVEYSDTSSESDYNNSEEPSANKTKLKLPNLTVIDLQNVSIAQNKSSESNRNSFDTSKRKKNADLGAVVIPKKKSKDNESIIGKTSASIVEIDDTLEIEEIDKSVVEHISLIELNRSKDSDVLSISDDDISGSIDVGMDIQLSNCKSKEKAPRKIRERDKISSFSKYWTSDMNKFYNSSWGLENFSIDDIQETMSDDQKMWKIAEEDRYYYRFSLPKGPRCHSCREFGHISINCPNGRRPIVCILCGQAGHAEPRCPNGLCTLCGYHGGYGTYCSKCVKWKNLQCVICQMYGHMDQQCPDLWRRYHLTTEPGPIVRPRKTIHKHPKDRWCSGCAQYGHYEYKCRQHTRSHHAVDPNIKEYFDLYNFPKKQPFIIRCDFTPTPPTATITKEPQKRKSNSPKSSISGRNIASPRTQGQLTNNAIEILNNSQQSQNMATIGDFDIRTEASKVDELNIRVTFDNFIFPPIEMIPPYFHSHVEAEKKNQQDNVIGNCVNSLPASWKDQKFVRNPVASCVDTSNTSRNSNTSTINLNCKQLGFIQSKNGISFVENIQSNMNVSIDINSNNNGPYPDGIVIISGKARDVRYTQRELKKFSNSIPKIKIIPMYSKAAHNFLSEKLDKVEKAAGNCNDLYKSLLKLQTQLKSGHNLGELKNRIRSIKIRLNMLLFGKLTLGEGQQHMCSLRRWQREFNEQEDHQIPFNVMFDILEAYSYIFLDTVNHEYQRFCVARANRKYNLSSPSRKGLKSIMGYFKLVETKCRKFKLYDKIEELHRLNTNLYNSNFSVRAFKEYMTFCHKVLRYVKIQSL